MPLSKELKTVHALFLALYKANLSGTHTLYLRTIPALISLHMLSCEGIAPSQNQLINYWVSARQAKNRTAGYALLEEWGRSGLIIRQKDKACIRVSLSISGKLYVDVFEQALKKMPKNQ